MKIRISTASRNSVVCCLLAIFSQLAHAQNPTANTHAKEADDDTIQLSGKFMNALKGAFEFAPMADTIRYKDELLTREQLLEWLGNTEPTQNCEGSVNPECRQSEGSVNKLGLNSNSDHCILDSTYKALKMWEVDPRANRKIPPTPPTIMMPNFAELFVMWKSKNGKYQIIRTPEGGTAMTGFDINALAKYIRPSQIRLRKSQTLARKNKAKMDEAFPLLLPAK